MTVAHRRERERRELRDQILSVARDIVLREGFDALTMRKIAKAIEYAPGTIYLYFKSREEIALQLVRDGFAELVRYMTPASKVADPVKRLAAIGTAYVKFGDANPETYRLIFMEAKPFYEAALNHGSADGDMPDGGAFGMLLATVEELIRKKVFRKIDPVRAAEMCWASVHGIVSLRIACGKVPHDDDLESMTKALTDMIARGLRAD